MKTYFIFSFVFSTVLLSAQKSTFFPLENFNHKTTKLAYGFWSLHTDSPNGGRSTVSSTDSAIRTEQNNYFISVDYHLDKGSFQWQPYVNVTFNLNKAKIPFLWGKTKGFTYRHKGVAHIFLLATQNINDFAYFQISIPESSEWQTVTVYLEELKQPSWGKRNELVLTDIFALMWQRNGKDGEIGSFSIDDVAVI
ncbi:MAG: hypothetical protein SNJ77_12340 [Cytophagales bacterium]